MLSEEARTGYDAWSMLRVSVPELGVLRLRVGSHGLCSSMVPLVANESGCARVGSPTTQGTRVAVPVPQEAMPRAARRYNMLLSYAQRARVACCRRLLSHSGEWSAVASSSLPVDGTCSGYINYVVFRALLHDVFRVNVTGVAAPPRTQYRIIVAGDGFSVGPHGAEQDNDAFNHFNIAGPFQSSYRTSKS